jgi:hypothetical protein
MGRCKKELEFRGCNDDCFNCTYPDCRKPSYKMGVDKHLQSALQVERIVSAPKMYTLELGGRGCDTPNLSRKYFR